MIYSDQKPYVGKKIFVEGADGAGKTTYIENLLKENPNFRVIHCTRHTNNNIEFFLNILWSPDNIILDRSYVGQFIYNNPATRDENNWLTLRDLNALENAIMSFKHSGYSFEMVYVYNDPEVCLYNCKKDAEDSYYTLEYIQELMSRYKFFFENISSIPVTYFKNDYNPLTNTTEATDVDYSSFDYSTLPKIVAVDFDGTLVTGAKFPEIGTLNKKLVHELYKGKYKDYKKILFTHRSKDVLIEACNFLADNNIYFDAVNDDIPEVKTALNRNPVDHRKIWFDVLIDDKVENANEYFE